MSKKEIMTNDPLFTSAVPFCADGPVAGSSRGEKTVLVTENGDDPRFSESHEDLDFGRESAEHYSSVVCEIRDKLVFVERTTISLVQSFRKIPLIESDQRLNSRCQKVVNKLDVMVETLIINGIVPTTEWDDSRPSEDVLVS